MSDPPLPIPLPVRGGPHADSGATHPRPAPERSRFLLDRARFVTLATEGPNGPWAATVNFVARWRPLVLVWYSLREATHSMNIVAQPRVSGSIFLTGLTGPNAPSGIPIDGAQFVGNCREATAGELPDYYEHYYATNFPDPGIRAEWALPIETFRDDGPRRFYRLEFERWWLYDAQRWTVDKNDTRFEVAVPEIELTNEGEWAG
ncbi:pyridoxamine 5'-phosphate oxidase family protein [Nocardia sp. BSTN01]|uniref:pyridoxamine 5'-phosphate oxidase family protein n=1 Tax=Nocardia sp. BSTN01 TaxID=2783665 RepID=UPI00188E4C8C|nr:pyridoxamine 5'-phosphate oxidase family protein [Nocardia sp. BSTN01]MBF5000394.1 pyridoxamine 5'-phosphate oxidase family protein [Nocardia sp. BSTN01]